MTPDRGRGLPRWCGASAVVLSLAVAAAIVATSDEHRLLAVLLAAATVWSAAPLVVLLLSGTGTVGATDPTPAGPTPTGPPSAAFTTIVRVGDEPLDIARTTVLLAAAAGPTIVLTGPGAPPQLHRLGVPVIEDADAAAGLVRAMARVDTSAILLVSGRAVPVADACRRGAARLEPGIGWVTGRTAPFSRDRYVGDSRHDVTVALVAAARRRGLVTWEPDATIIATELLRSHPLDADRPLGSWLRRCAGEGWGGAALDEPIARRAAPVDAAAYWPDTIARQWGRTADLAAAIGTGSTRCRLLAAGLTLRELFAVPLLFASALPLFAAGPTTPSTTTVMVASVAVAAAGIRWAALRQGLGLPMRPLRDVTAAMHSTPGSLVAVGAAVTRRRRAPRLALPERPLVWAALLLTVVTGARLVDGTTARPSAPVMGTALAALAALWAFSMGALAQRNWERSTYRVPLDVGLVSAGTTFRTVNGSPSGLALVRQCDGPDVDATATRLAVSIALDDGTAIDASARVSGRRRSGDREVIGLVLNLGDRARAAWVDQLDRAAQGSGPERAGARVDALTRGPAAPDDGPRRGRAARVLDGAGAALAAIVSLVVVAALVLVLFGFHPLVIRSASMTPTYAIGDVVVSENVLAGDLRPGDVATVPADAIGETLTHRVVSVAGVGSSVTVETRGDANTTGERVVLDAGTTVGRVRWSVPWLGRPANSLRSSPVRVALVGAAAALLITAVRRRVR